MRLSSWLAGFGLLWMVSCVEPFIPDTSRYTEVLFIECRVTDHTGLPPRLIISRSAPIATQEGDRLTFQPEPVVGAVSQLLGSDGSVFHFLMDSAGYYSLAEPFAAVTGLSYQLRVEFDGNLYESEFEKLLPPVPVDSLTAKPAVRKVTQDGDVNDGLRFFASNHQSAAGPSYYRWDLEATWQYQVPYEATHKWDGVNQNPDSNRDIRTCWKTKNIPGIFIASTEGLAENRVSESPLHFESQYGDELTIRYSLKARQYVIGANAFDFWTKVDKLVNQSGGLYETLPYRVEGNIHCTTDPKALVTGILEVAGVSEARAFFNRPPEFKIIPFECFLSEVGTRSFPWFRLPAGSWLVHYPEARYFASTPACFDCRERGGTLVKPPFWIE